MAITTRNQRMAVMNPMCPWRGLWPIPDGVAFTAADRAQILFLARDSFADAGGAAVVRYVPTFRRRRR